MKFVFSLLLSVIFISAGFTQDTSKPLFQNDTIKLNRLQIVKINSVEQKDWETVIRDFDYNAIKVKFLKKNQEFRNLETSWLAFDFGLAGYMDYTKYTSIKTFMKPAIGQPLTYTKLQPKNSSTNINIWVVQQKANLYKHKWYLKYGLGFEMFNYYFANPIDYRNSDNGYISLSSNNYSKNKLYLNYITVPVQLSRSIYVKNFQPITLSGGLSIGYLYKAKNKQISESLGKVKYHGDFNFADYKVASIFQLGIGDLKFYASASLNNIMNKSATAPQSNYPYTFGLRFSKF